MPAASPWRSSAGRSRGRLGGGGGAATLAAGLPSGSTPKPSSRASN